MGFFRYLLPKIKNSGLKNNKKVDIEILSEGDETESLKKLKDYNLKKITELYSLPIQNKALIFYRTKNETINGNITYAEKIFRDHATENRIPVYLLSLDVDSDYRDKIHPNVNGQYKLSKLIEQIINDNEKN